MIQIKKLYNDSCQRIGSAGFTLVEITAVILVVVILIILVATVTMQVSSRGSFAKCAANLRNYYIMINSYANDHSQSYMTPGYQSGKLQSYWNYNLCMGGYCTVEQMLSLRCPELYTSNEVIGGMSEREWARTGNVNTIGYSYNIWLAGKKTISIQEPSKVALLLESHFGTPVVSGVSGSTKFAFRHQDSLNILYCDGHIELRNKSTPFPAFTDTFWAYPPMFPTIP